MVGGDGALVSGPVAPLDVGVYSPSQWDVGSTADNGLKGRYDFPSPPNGMIHVRASHSPDAKPRVRHSPTRPRVTTNGKHSPERTGSKSLFRELPPLQMPLKPDGSYEAPAGMMPGRLPDITTKATAVREPRGSRCCAGDPDLGCTVS